MDSSNWQQQSCRYDDILLKTFKISIKRTATGVDRATILACGPYTPDIRATIRNFITSPESELGLPAMSPPERAAVHQLAQMLGLLSVSRGDSEARSVVLTKRPQPDGSTSPQQPSSVNADIGCVEERIVWSHYLSLQSVAVDAAARRGSEVVPLAYAEKQQHRDGSSYHFTLMPKWEVEWCLQVLQAEDRSMSDQEALQKFQVLLAGLPSTWSDVGLGTACAHLPLSDTAQTVGNRIYYKVIRWDAFQALRTTFGLPFRHLHITVGFQFTDMFHVDKSEATLLHRNPPLDSHRDWWPKHEVCAVQSRPRFSGYQRRTYESYSQREQFEYQTQTQYTQQPQRADRL